MIDALGHRAGFKELEDRISAQQEMFGEVQRELKDLEEATVPAEPEQPTEEDWTSYS